MLELRITTPISVPFTLFSRSPGGQGHPRNLLEPHKVQNTTRNNEGNNGVEQNRRNGFGDLLENNRSVKNDVVDAVVVNEDSREEEEPRKHPLDDLKGGPCRVSGLDAEPTQTQEYGGELPENKPREGERKDAVISVDGAASHEDKVVDDQVYTAQFGKLRDKMEPIVNQISQKDKIHLHDSIRGIRILILWRFVPQIEKKIHSANASDGAVNDAADVRRALIC